MTLSIQNSRYAFSIRLNLIFSMSLWKGFQLLQILNDLSIRHLMKLILYDNDVKLLKFKRRPVEVDLWYVWSVIFWLLTPEMNTSRTRREWLICFSIVNFNSLNLNCQMFLIKRLYWIHKDSFIAPSPSVIKKSNIFQKNSVYPKTVYLHSFPLLTSTSLQNL